MGKITGNQTPLASPPGWPAAHSRRVFIFVCTLQFRFMSHAKSIVRNNQNYDGLIYPAANSMKGRANNKNAALALSTNIYCCWV
jgi:hypothetical protein